ncbi:hypothetical protein AB0M45_05280 [Nocardia sp. NPDC051787]|uniref:hypothetical protein n=1 Tax=Nocardia sp. NPDC051787 TaxID=3155415 RepID=UPI00343AAB91
MAIPVERVLVRTDDVVAALVGARTYRSGIELSFHLHVRPASEHSAIGSFASYGGGMTEQFLVGVQFADGRTATNIDRWRPDEHPDTPVLMNGGASASDDLSATSYYLTPLPPPGPLTVIAAWPAIGIAEQHVELDTDPFLRATRTRRSAVAVGNRDDDARDTTSTSRVPRGWKGLGGNGFHRDMSASASGAAMRAVGVSSPSSVGLQSPKSVSGRAAPMASSISAPPGLALGSGGASSPVIASLIRGADYSSQ